MSKLTNIIQTTEDYDQFQLLGANRKVNKKHVQKLINSIEKYGYLPDKAISVNEHNVVIDGQHRLEALKALELPVPYIVITGADAEHALAMNITNRPWTLPDYMNYYSVLGVKPYVELTQLAREFPSYSIGSLIAIAIGYKQYGAFKAFRNGDFAEFDVEAARERLEQLDSLNELTPIFTTQSLIQAYLVALNHESFDPDRFYETLRKRGGVFTLHMRYTDNLREIEYVYNSGSGKSIRLL